MKLDLLKKISLPSACRTVSFSPAFTVNELVSSDAGHPYIIKLYNVAEPGTDPHYHKIKTQTYIILEGETTLHVGRERHILKAGQIVTIPPHLFHTLEQESPVRFLVIDWPNIDYPEDHYEEISEALNIGSPFVSSLLMTESIVNQNQSVPVDLPDLIDFSPSAYQNRIDLPSHTVYEIGQDSDHKWSLAIIEVKDVVPHFHEKGTEHFIVLSGQLKIELQGVTHRLTAGQSAHIAPGHIHHLKSANTQAVRLLCMNFPAFDPRDLHLSGW